MRGIRPRYTLVIMTDDGEGRTYGHFPSREIAEDLGRTLKNMGVCLCFDVHGGDW